MSETIGSDAIRKMVLTAAAKILDNHQELSRLDAATGDGDHGTTMQRAMQAVQKAESEKADAPAGDLLHACGWEIMCADGGSTGPLFGSLFMGMAKPAKGKEAFSGGDLAEMYEAALTNVQKQTKAQVGDKTMMDAFIPAVAAALKAAEAGSDVASVAIAAAEAAVAGAKSTEKLQAKFGRARNLGERSIGHVDAGATSMSYLLGGFAEALNA